MTLDAPSVGASDAAAQVLGSSPLMSRSRPPLQGFGKTRDTRKNSAFRLVGNVVLVVHNSVAPTNDEWESYIKTVLRGGKLYGGDLTLCRQLVLTDGGGPNSAQRAVAQKAAEQMGGAAMPVAVVSSSTFVRGIVTAFNWFNMNLRAFSPLEITKALSFLKVDALTIDAIWEELALVEAEIGPVETVRTIRESYKNHS